MAAGEDFTLEGDSEGIDDSFEFREAIGETGIDEFAQTVGEAIGQHMQAQHAPPALTEGLPAWLPTRGP